MGKSKELADRATKLFNAGDLDGFVSTYADDAVLCLPQGTYEGREAIRAAWAQQWAAFPDGHVDPGLLVEQGDVVAEEFTLTGTNTGPIAMRDGSTVPASGKRLEIEAMELLKLRDSKIVRHDIFLDSAAFLVQLGVPLPASGG